MIVLADHSNCFQIAGWWTYEFCYGKHIRQFHQEKDLPVRPQDEFFLGRWTGSSKEEHHTDTDYKYFSLRYSEGTTCDLTGQKRASEVRFSCSPEKSLTTFADIKVHMISITVDLIYF